MSKHTLLGSFRQGLPSLEPFNQCRDIFRRMAHVIQTSRTRIAIVWPLLSAKAGPEENPTELRASAVSSAA